MTTEDVKPMTVEALMRLAAFAGAGQKLVIQPAKLARSWVAFIAAEAYEEKSGAACPVRSFEGIGDTPGQAFAALGDRIKSHVTSTHERRKSEVAERDAALAAVLKGVADG